MRTPNGRSTSRVRSTTCDGGLTMGFSRAVALDVRPPTGTLTARMAGIGINLATEAEIDADIEGTLVHASSLGVDDGDLRALSLVTTWFGVHHRYVNADRLVRLVDEHPSERVVAFWSALAKWLKKDRRFTRLATTVRGGPFELLPVGTDFQIRRRGEDARFAGSRLRVPQGTLRDRLQDVLAPEVLVRRHAGYRNRVRMGPTWRADVWSDLEREPNATIAEVARRVGCSFATAWQVAQDFRLLRGASGSEAEKRARA
jgi:hypothetical protein